MQVGLLIMKNFIIIIIFTTLAAGCGGNRISSVIPQLSEQETMQVNGEHRAAYFILRLDGEANDVSIIPERETSGHLNYDGGWFGEYPPFFKVEIADNDPFNKKVTFKVTLRNVSGIPVYDPRLILYCEPGATPVNPDAYTDYYPDGNSLINPFFAFAKPHSNRMLMPGKGDSREIAVEYISPAKLLEMHICLDVCIGGNTAEPYALENICQRGRGIYANVFDWQDDAADIRAAPVTGSSEGVLLNRIDDEPTWSATLYFPEDAPSKLLISAGSEGTEHHIYNYADWDPAAMPVDFGPAIYAWTFYDPDTGGLPVSLGSVVTQCKQRFGGSWLIANMGQTCYNGSIVYDENDFELLATLKAQYPDFTVFLNLGHLGFGPDDYDLSGKKFDGNFRLFFRSLRVALLGLNQEYKLAQNAKGFSFDFEIPMSQFPLPYRAEFLDAYGDFIARLRRDPSMAGVYFCSYLDALMPEMLNYDYEAMNHCKQADFFLAAAFPASYVMDQNWWLHPGHIPQYWEVPSAFDYLVGMLDTFSGIAKAVSSPFHPVVDLQGAWLDYKGDTLPIVQPCSWKYLANISDWCFGHADSFKSSDELVIAQGGWLHKKLIERVIADIPETNVDVLGKIGGIFVVLGDDDPDTVGDDVICARTPFGIRGIMNVINNYDDSYRLDIVLFHWEVAQDWKMYGALNISPTGLGAVSGRISFADGSTFYKHMLEYHEAHVTVDGLPDGLPDYFYGTDIIGFDDGSYALGGLPAGLTVTLQASAGAFVSDPVEVEIGDVVHTRGVDLVLHAK